MTKFNVKEHNQKMVSFAQEAASGVFPSKKAVTLGAYVCIIAGIVLLVFGGIGMITKNIWGFGSVLAGLVLIVCNAFHLKRIKGK